MTIKMQSAFELKKIGKIPPYLSHSDNPDFYRIQGSERSTFPPITKPEQVTSAPKRSAQNQHKSKMKKAVKYINSNLTHNLSLDEVAQHVELSSCYFSKLFKKQYKIGFNLFVNQQRMKQAKLLLDMQELSIATVAKNLGFSQTSYFCRLFRQIYQITPQSYRNQSNNN